MDFRNDYHDYEDYLVDFCALYSVKTSTIRILRSDLTKKNTKLVDGIIDIHISPNNKCIGTDEEMSINIFDQCIPSDKNNNELAVPTCENDKSAGTDMDFRWIDTIENNNVKYLYYLLKTFYEEKDKTQLKTPEGKCKFIIHGGCVRNIFDGRLTNDYDIIFSCSSDMKLFSRVLYGVMGGTKEKTHPEYLNIVNRINSALVEKSLINPKGNCKVGETSIYGPQFSGLKLTSFVLKTNPSILKMSTIYTKDKTQRIDLDLCSFDQMILALDYSVNGLYINEEGLLKSKCKLPPNVIIEHIKNKKTVKINIFDLDNVGELFKPSHKKFLQLFVNKFINNDINYPLSKKIKSVHDMPYLDTGGRESKIIDNGYFIVKK